MMCMRNPQQPALPAAADDDINNNNETKVVFTQLSFYIDTDKLLHQLINVNFYSLLLNLKWCGWSLAWFPTTYNLLS